MFYDTEIQILSSYDEASIIKTVEGDVQPYTNQISFEDGYQIPITKRAFCENDEAITINSFFLIHNHKFKVMEIKERSDYLEVFLYECKV